jgi:hypothetical protein
MKGRALFTIALLSAVLSFKIATPLLTAPAYIKKVAPRVTRNVSDALEVPVVTPRIEFTKLRNHEAARYDEKNDTVYLSVDLIYGAAFFQLTPQSQLVGERPAEEKKTIDALLNVPLSQQEMVLLDQALTHEIAHAAMDQYNTKRGRGNWPDWDAQRKAHGVMSMLALRTIGEGVATYVEHKYYPQEKTEAYWPTFWPNPDHPLGYLLFTHVIYDSGEHLVSDILEKHGREGLEYLTTHPPDAKNPSELIPYKQKAMLDLTLP